MGGSGWLRGAVGAACTLRFRSPCGDFAPCEYIPRVRGTPRVLGASRRGRQARSSTPLRILPGPPLGSSGTTRDPSSWVSPWDARRGSDCGHNTLTKFFSEDCAENRSANPVLCASGQLNLLGSIAQDRTMAFSFDSHSVLDVQYRAVQGQSHRQLLGNAWWGSRCCTTPANRAPFPAPYASRTFRAAMCACT